MAISDANMDEIRANFWRLGIGKDELKLHPTLPDYAHFKAAFQVIDTAWENNRAALKTAFDAALGVTTTATEAKKLLLAWMIFKMGLGG